ncbi:MAG: peptide deformylase [Alphaproteobacteria bacterium]
MTLQLRYYPDDVLRKRALPVQFSAAQQPEDSILQLIARMKEVMQEDEGIGLAATQVGVLQRVVVIDIPPDEEITTPQQYVMLNPEILSASDEKATQREGCLSLPDLYAEITRPAHIKVGFINEQGKAQEIEATGLLSACIQHEIDHLNGVLFIDYLTRLKRDSLLRRLQKMRKFSKSEQPI